MASGNSRTWGSGDSRTAASQKWGNRMGPTKTPISAIVNYVALGKARTYNAHKQRTHGFTEGQGPVAFRGRLMAGPSRNERGNPLGGNLPTGGCPPPRWEGWLELGTPEEAPLPPPPPPNGGPCRPIFGRGPRAPVSNPLPTSTRAAEGSGGGSRSCHPGGKFGARHPATAATALLRSPQHPGTARANPSCPQFPSRANRHWVYIWPLFPLMRNARL